MRNTKSAVSAFFAFLLMITLFGPFQAQSVCADDDNDLIVVSLGDSYSSGEGIEPFYGQELGINKINDANWLAHRSVNSWPGMLTVPGRAGMDNSNSICLKDFHYQYGERTTDNCKWYFVASSGATTSDFYNHQEKIVRQKGVNGNQQMKYLLVPQFDVFDHVFRKIDYVTLSVGGNDVNFSKIVLDCVTGSSYLHFGEKNKLEKRMDILWSNIESTKANIKKVYRDIAEKAPEADIIVAGYPELFNKKGSDRGGLVIDIHEATLVDENVRLFNDVLYRLVQDCRESGIKIHFVDVEDEFEKDGGHQAFTDDPWLNAITLIAKDQDIDYLKVGSAYSIHPNLEGARAYARCVNSKIAEIEENRTEDDNDIQGGTISDSWDEIIVSCKDGTYKSKYKIGDTKALDLGAEGIVEMQIAAFDADELADGSGKAAITWISKQVLNSQHRMNPELEGNSKTGYVTGTGAVGGWAYSEMRTWLQQDVKPLIPPAVRKAIKPVTKYSTSYDSSLNYLYNTETSDDVWIPSGREIFGEYSNISEPDYENKGPVYSELFGSASARYKEGIVKNSNWALRSARYDYYAIETAGSGKEFKCVWSYDRDMKGNFAGIKAQTEEAVALGFCT